MLDPLVCQTLEIKQGGGGLGDLSCRLGCEGAGKSLTCLRIMLSIPSTWAAGDLPFSVWRKEVRRDITGARWRGMDHLVLGGHSD